MILSCLAATGYVCSMNYACHWVEAFGQPVRQVCVIKSYNYVYAEDGLFHIIKNDTRLCGETGSKTAFYN